MSDVTQPYTVRGTKPLAVGLATTLIALLAFAPFASAASDPVASGTTTVTFSSAFTKTLKKFGIKLTKTGSAKVSKKKATFTVTGGSLDPTTGIGSVTLGGGLQFKAGKKKAPVKALVLDTSKKRLTATVAGKKNTKTASISGFTFARNGFGVNLSVKKLKLTGSAASQLNKKLGFTGKSKGKSGKGARVSKSPAKPFKGNQLLGSAAAETQPSTVALVPTGNTALTLSKAALAKLKNVGPEVGGEHPFEVKLSLIPPAQLLGISGEGTPIAGFPISGGSISPTATAGVVQHTGGLKLVQDLEALGPNGKGQTTLEMASIWLDLGTKQATVEVTITNPKTPEANLGNLGRVSIADINLTGATITANPATRTVSIQNGTATLQALTASTLNAVFVEPIEGKGKGTFAAGDPLGTFSFTAQTQ
jgi:hypothetical protein